MELIGIRYRHDLSTEMWDWKKRFDRMMDRNGEDGESGAQGREGVETGVSSWSVRSL